MSIVTGTVPYSVIYCPAPIPSENIIEICVSSTIILEFKKMAETAYWVVNQMWKPPCMYAGFKSTEKSTEYVYGFFILLSIYTGQIYIHSVYIQCGFHNKTTASMYIFFLFLCVYIQVALYVYGQSLHTGPIINIYRYQ